MSEDSLSDVKKNVGFSGVDYKWCLHYLKETLKTEGALKNAQERH